MKTLVVVNEKGGVGKTNIAAHAGWFFAERHRTLVIDLDQQANLSATLGAHLATAHAVDLFAGAATIEPVGALTVARSTRDLLRAEAGADAAVVETFRDNLLGMADTFDVCVIDTPPSLTNRTLGALLAADAVLAPIGISDYSIQGVTALLQAIKGVAAHYRRPEPRFLGLLPSIYDRKSRRERELFESLTQTVGKMLFPGIVAKRDAYAKAAADGTPVWNLRGAAAREAATEIRGIFERVAAEMELDS